MQIDWRLKKFDEVSPHELYAILQLRNAVFVVEQNCVFQDADNKDQPSYHVMGWMDNQLIAYTRLVPAGIGYDVPSIGRVVTAAVVRGKGVGKLLMQHSIAQLYQLFGRTPIKIGAQLYLQQFYESLDFVRVSEVYLEDGIEHIYMVKHNLL